MIIYKITNNVNSKIYIGKTKLSAEERFKKHIINSKSYTTRLYSSMRHHGIDNFSISIIEETSPNDVNDREVYWIKKLNTQNSDIGYNMTPGGDGGGVVKGTKQNSTWISKRIKSMRETLGDPEYIHPLKNCTQSEEKRKKISKTLSGVPHTKERRKNQSLAAKKRKKIQCENCNRFIDICNIRRHSKACQDSNF